ncbi:MAG: TVP38/TMEM64 family protein [Cyanobacteria bacterium P01_F01_bin.150]
MAVCIGSLRNTAVMARFGIVFDQAAWVQYLNQHGDWSVAIFLVAHTVAALVGVPGTFLVFIGGLVFGLFWGTVWSVVGATLGAIAAFCLARYCLRHWVEQRFSHHTALKKINRLVKHNDLSCVLAIRFAPISPFSVVNFLFGLTRVRFKTYTVGTFVGIIPGTLAYTWLGVTGWDAWNGKGMLPLMLSLGLLALLSAVPFLTQYRPSVSIRK